MSARILVIDDEPATERLFNQLFRRKIQAGAYTFQFVLNGERAWEVLDEEEKFDLVLTDINIPGMDGLDFISQLREADPLQKLIIITAYGDMRNIRKAMNLGAFDFLTKPIDFKDLETTIEKTIKEVEVTKRAEMARELALRNEKLRELDQLKSHFFDNVSQEFKNPLNLLNGMVGQMSERIADLGVEDQFLADRLDRIERKSNRLLELINQIMQLRKLPAGKTQRHPIQEALPIRREAMDRIGDGSSATDNAAVPSLSLLPTDPEKIPPENILPSLLIVEDNADIQDYLQSCLEDRYALSFARDGREGMEKALKELPDLIISDLTMPRKNGYELCHTLKNDRRSRHIPIMLLTTEADDTSRLTGLTRVADACLLKPFHKKELLIHLDKLLALRHKLTEPYAGPDDLIDPQSTTGDQKQEDSFLLEVHEILESHISDEFFGVRDLYAKLGIGRSQFFKKIKTLTGRSAAIYIRSIRLRKALTLLHNTALNITEVAYQVGFHDPNYFSRTFSQEFGISPKEARKYSEK